MKRIFLLVNIIIYILCNSTHVQAMELIRNDSAETVLLNEMDAKLNTNHRIGKIGTLILSETIQNNDYARLKEDIYKHHFIKSQIKRSVKAFKLYYYYNPFTIYGTCEQNNTPLATAILLMLQQGFNPEHERNELNDHYFNENIKNNDLLNGFKQVDYCVSAKNSIDPDNKEIITYIARFFNKKALKHTIKSLDPNNIIPQE